MDTRDRRQLPPWARLLALALLTFVAGLFGATVVSDDEGRSPPPATSTVELHGPQPGAQTVEVPRPALDAAKRSDVGDHEGMRSEVPTGAPAAQLEAAREQQDQLAADDQLPIVSPDAAPSQRGCTTRLVRNYSSRRGVRPRLLVVHYTVSPNRAGWGDVWAVVSLFDRAAFAASSSYVIDAEGHCAYIVRESDKPWTQAAANPVSISVEVVNSGRERALFPSQLGKLPDPGLRRIGQVFADAARRWQIPLQAGRVAGCRVTRPGVIDHHALGLCGGGHVDVSPYNVAPVITAARRAAGKPRAPTTTDRTTCRKLEWWRRHGRPHGAAERNATRRRRALDARRVTCTRHGPVRR